MANYAEYLRTQGATEDEIKILDVPVARKAYEDTVAAAEARVADYKAKADKWYEETITPAYTKAQADAQKAAAEAARLRALVASSTDEGLRKVAEEMGYKLDGTSAPKTPAADDNKLDTSKFLTLESIREPLDRAGDGLAAMQDMVLEHMQLFPDRPLNVRAIRNEALAAHKNVYEFWEQKFAVPAAREARTVAAAKANEERIRKEERDKVTAEFTERIANPNLTSPTSSSNVFAARKATGREKQPWEVGLDGENGSADRVTRGTKLFVQKQQGQTS